MEAISRGFGSGLKANLARIRELRSVIKSERARVVISFNTSTNVLATLAVQGLACRLIVSERNYPAHSAANRFWSVARKFTYKLADTVVVQTKPGALWLERNTLAKSVEVVPNSISLPIPRLEPTVNPDDHLPADRRVILAVGKIQRQKGFDLLLEACAQLTSSSNEWVLVIAGAGDNQALRQQSEQAGLADRVLFPGRVGYFRFKFTL